MEVVVFVFLSSGLFLGWSLGANDAANIFGTAVGTRIVRFATAALVCSVFVVLGAVSQALIVVVHGDREHPLGMFLADHVVLEDGTDVTGARDPVA